MPFNPSPQSEAQQRRPRPHDPSAAGGGVRHPDQPQPDKTSRSAAKVLLNHDALGSAIGSLELAYKACKNTIEGSRNLATTRCGEQCIGIIDRRLEFLTKDLGKNRARIATALRKADEAGIVGESRC